MEFNTNNIRKTPINRNNLFFSDESFIFEEELASNYITQDMNQTIVLFEVDWEKTNLNQLYYESKKDGIVFKTPVELHVVYEIEEPDLKTYDSNKNYGSYLKSGKLFFDVLFKTFCRQKLLLFIFLLIQYVYELVCFFFACLSKRLQK